MKERTMHETIETVIRRAKLEWAHEPELVRMLEGVATFYHRHVPRLEMVAEGEAPRLVGDCPLCRRARGFSAEILNGNWHCRGCHEAGMLDDFIRLRFGKSREEARAIADHLANAILGIG